MATPPYSIDLSFSDGASVIKSWFRTYKSLNTEFCSLITSLFPNHLVTPTSMSRVGFFAYLQTRFKPGDEIIVSAISFPIYIAYIHRLELRPVFVDIAPNTLSINPKEIEKRITKKTKAILVTHMFGQAAPLNEIISIAKKHQIIIIEDCAQSFGTFHQGSRTGTFGEISFFSMSLSKSPTSMGGGFFLCKSEDLQKKVQRQIEINIQNEKCFIPKRKIIVSQLISIACSYNIIYSLLHPFFKYLLNYYPLKLKEVFFNDEKSVLTSNPFERESLYKYQLAFAISQIKRNTEVITLRQKRSSFYLSNFKQENSPLLFPDRGMANSSYNEQAFIALCDGEREKLTSYMMENGVHLMWEGLFDCTQFGFYQKGTCPIAEKYGPKIIRLPHHSTISKRSQLKIINLLSCLYNS
jgi:perosamine synthetase